MTNYKDTLNLPQTAFPMKANLAQREPQLLARWQEMGLYQQLQKMWQSRPKFILHDGPPYANGNIHLGHAVNKVLKDIVVKSKNISGFATPYVPGWDCHGLPIELNVEKKHGKAGDKISAKQFRQACRDYAQGFIDIQREEFMRLGLLGDWFKPYLTMDYHYEANVIRALGKVIEKGVVTQGYKPVFWCFDCASALAQAEVEYKDKQSPSIYVRFPVVDEPKILSAFNAENSGHGAISVVIWTTTPWTLPANEAVAVHPKFIYDLVQVNDERLLIAHDLVTPFMQIINGEDYSVLASVIGEKLLHHTLKHPMISNKWVPILLAEHVTLEAGTGAVHTAPAHGPDDYQVAKNYGLPIHNPVLSNGLFSSEVPHFAGLHVLKANKTVLEFLQAKNLLIHASDINHSYPHCWRHKTPLIFRATPQWFISMEETDLRQRALNAIAQVKWFPPQGEKRLSTMVENNPDWCISRQRTWGTPIPVFLHKETAQPHPRTPEIIEQVAKAVEKNGIDAWYDIPAAELIGSDASDYEKSHDVLDVWFDSGVTHYCVLKQLPELNYPADMYLEGSDQHRGWFQSSLLTGVVLNDQAPYRQVLTHGFTIDENGHKMSKSLGNVIPPEKIIQTMGADILRLWIASTDYRGEITCSHELFNRTADTYRRLRNTLRYLLANICDFDPSKDSVAYENLVALDRYVLGQAYAVQQEVCQAYETYQFHEVIQTIHHFCTLTLGAFYLDVIKDRIYTMPTQSLARRSAQTVMYHIAESLVRWLAPILSFTADEVWQYLPNRENDSVFLNTWYAELKSLNDPQFTQSDWENIIAVREAVYKELEIKRNQGEIGSSLAAEITLYCSDKLLQQLKVFNDELRFIFITSYATVLPLSEANHSDSTMTIGNETLRVQVSASQHAKCVRCWHHREEVGQHPSHPELCSRCVTNIEKAGEIRQFA
ncbi:MAG: isoleucine--tRNA ligase [Legionellales bacterium]|nr:isoleucine--tRNA ligase [Legionellales bacterium]